MSETSSKEMLESLRRQIGKIASDGNGEWDFRQPSDPVPPQAVTDRRTAAPAERGPFGRWLLQQGDARGLLGELVKCAKTDPGFPKDGDPEAVRARLRSAMADGDMFEAVDEAELDWSSF